jgi:hypothetical protein
MDISLNDGNTLQIAGKLSETDQQPHGQWYRAPASLRTGESAIAGGAFARWVFRSIYVNHAAAYHGHCANQNVDQTALGASTVRATVREKGSPEMTTATPLQRVIRHPLGSVHS